MPEAEPTVVSNTKSGKTKTRSNTTDRPVSRPRTKPGNSTGRALEAERAAKDAAQREAADRMTMATTVAREIRDEVYDFEPDLIAHGFDLSGINAEDGEGWEIVIPADDIKHNIGGFTYEMEAGRRYRIPASNAAWLRGWLWQ